MPQFTCKRPLCEKEFYSRHSTAKFCSRRCANSVTAVQRVQNGGYINQVGVQRQTDEDLLRRVTDRAADLGRTPSKREIPGARTIARRFGSYNNAVLAAGLIPNVALPPSYLEDDRHLVSLSIRFRVLCRDGFRCQYCGGTPQDGYVLHVDHRKPRSQGGKTELDNLITACLLCNSGKSDNNAGS